MVSWHLGKDKTFSDECSFPNCAASLLVELEEPAESLWVQTEVNCAAFLPSPPNLCH